MKKYILSALFGAALLVGTSGATFAKIPWFHRGHASKKAAMKPKVTMEQAQAIALKKFSGTVNDSKTNTVRGKEVFWFEITNNKGQKSQIWVNGESGKVTRMEKEKAAKPMKSKK